VDSDFFDELNDDSVLLRAVRKDSIEKLIAK